MTASDIVNALVGSTVLAAAAREVWRWYTTRAERADAARTAGASDVAALLREQIAAGETRAERGAERAVAMAAALASSASATTDLARAVERVPLAIDALAERLERVERTLAVVDARMSPLTSEHRAGGAS